MGQEVSTYVLPNEEIEEYQVLTFLSRQEIIRAHKMFMELANSEEPHHGNIRLSSRIVSSLPELKVNPFRDRICMVFADEDGEFSFDEFLEMMSVLSDNAPLKVKIEYAFRIYDFNGNNYIDEEDLWTVILRLINQNELSEDEITSLVEHILEEADLDNDNFLTPAEFENAIAKAPDFFKSFNIFF
uniref:Calcium and integrin binding family member 4 n=1 Tax=Latimeria chalumnae TaxID=7897 RepID=M3XJC6_LATCH|nr:PREDICTED: calcium and integrin-binding family member 4 isoform X1 [Latimeria chalumnae]|eukprot:XP_005990973.2 PREDICTED: calcium and integrin-binding family member 4 isoform X1 [Latimeria chalumnae]